MAGALTAQLSSLTLGGGRSQVRRDALAGGGGRLSHSRVWAASFAPLPAAAFAAAEARCSVCLLSQGLPSFEGLKANVAVQQNNIVRFTQVRGRVRLHGRWLATALAAVA